MPQMQRLRACASRKQAPGASLQVRVFASRAPIVVLHDTSARPPARPPGSHILDKRSPPKKGGMQAAKMLMAELGMDFAELTWPWSSACGW